MPHPTRKTGFSCNNCLVLFEEAALFTFPSKQPEQRETKEPKEAAWQGRVGTDQCVFVLEVLEWGTKTPMWRSSLALKVTQLTIFNTHLCTNLDFIMKSQLPPTFLFHNNIWPSAPGNMINLTLLWVLPITNAMSKKVYKVRESSPWHQIRRSASFNQSLQVTDCVVTRLCTCRKQTTTDIIKINTSVIKTSGTGEMLDGCHKRGTIKFSTNETTKNWSSIKTIQIALSLGFTYDNEKYFPCTTVLSKFTKYNISFFGASAACPFPSCLSEIRNRTRRSQCRSHKEASEDPRTQSLRPNYIDFSSNLCTETGELETPRFFFWKVTPKVGGWLKTEASLSSNCLFLLPFLWRIHTKCWDILTYFLISLTKV